MCQLTDFQKKMLEYIEQSPTHRVSTWNIAQYAFPEKWARPQGRGALIGHIERAGDKMSDKMYRLLPDDRLPPDDRFRGAIFCLNYNPVMLTLGAGCFNDSLTLGTRNFNDNM